jgi:hypothetical protein
MWLPKEGSEGAFTFIKELKGIAALFAKMKTS